MEVLVPRRWTVLNVLGKPGYSPNRWAMEHVHGRKERFIAGTTARQVGKTLCAVIELDTAMNQPVDPKFGPPWVGVLAPTYSKAELLVNQYITMLIKTFGAESFHANTNKHILEIVDPRAGTVGARLNWLSGEDPYEAGTGFTFSKLLVDEGQNVSDEVFRKIRPTVSVREGSIAAFGTPDITPEQSWFKGMWLMGQGEDPQYHSFTVTAEQNKHMSLEEIEAARSAPGMTENEFKRLYLGEWVDEEGQVFSQYERSLLDIAPQFDITQSHIMSVDLAVYEDFTAVFIAERATGMVVFKDRWNQTDPVVTYERLYDIWESHGKPLVIADETGMGIPMVRELRDRGMRVQGVNITAQSKMPMIQGLSAALQHRRIMFPKAWDDVIREFQGFIYRRTPSGKITAAAAAGFHDDYVMSLVLLNEGLKSRGRSVSNQQWSYLTAKAV